MSHDGNWLALGCRFADIGKIHGRWRLARESVHRDLHIVYAPVVVACRRLITKAPLAALVRADHFIIVFEDRTLEPVGWVSDLIPDDFIAVAIGAIGFRERVLHSLR